MQLMTNRRFRVPAFIALAATIAMGQLAVPRGAYAQAATAQAPINTYNATHHPVVGRNGMVATQNFLATRIGVDILRQGGNAVDAGVAVGLALAVTLPRAGNVGGGGFILVHLAEENRTVVVDFRETAPAAAHSDMFFGEDGEVDNEEYRFSHKSSAIPASVAGFDHLLREYGTMSWREAAQPAIELARDGMVVWEDLAVNLARSKPRLSANPASRAKFYKPDGSNYEVGDLYRQPDLAWTLEQIAEGGADAFYKGEIARRIAADMAKHNGLITLDDLANYRVTEREPVRGTFRGYDIAAMSAPSSGGMHIVQMLNIFENFPLKEMGYGSADAMHVMAESMKLAYADRSKYLGDPDYLDLPVAALTSKDYAAELAKGISLSRARPSSDVGPGNLAPYESPETTHYSVLDSEGNALVNTYTLMFSYGSGVVIDGTGILMNNNLGNFTLRPDIPDAFGLMGSADNQIAAGTPAGKFDDADHRAARGTAVPADREPGRKPHHHDQPAASGERARARHEHRRRHGAAPDAPPVVSGPAGGGERLQPRCNPRAQGPRSRRAVQRRDGEPADGDVLRRTLLRLRRPAPAGGHGAGVLRGSAPDRKRVARANPTQGNLTG